MPFLPSNQQCQSTEGKLFLLALVHNKRKKKDGEPADPGSDGEPADPHSDGEPADPGPRGNSRQKVGSSKVLVTYCRCAYPSCLVPAPTSAAVPPSCSVEEAPSCGRHGSCLQAESLQTARTQRHTRNHSPHGGRENPTHQLLN